MIDFEFWIGEEELILDGGFLVLNSKRKMGKMGINF